MLKRKDMSTTIREFISILTDMTIFNIAKVCENVAYEGRSVPKDGVFAVLALMWKVFSRFFSFVLLSLVAGIYSHSADAVLV